MTLPAQPIVDLARQMLVQSKIWGPAVEAGILTGAWDKGLLIADYFDEAEQQLIRQQAEDIADD